MDIVQCGESWRVGKRKSDTARKGELKITGENFVAVAYEAPSDKYRLVIASD